MMHIMQLKEFNPASPVKSIIGVKRVFILKALRWEEIKREPSILPVPFGLSRDMQPS
jgi:hypothetical protein